MRALQKFLRSPIIPDWQYLPLKKVAKLEYGAPLADNVREQGDVPVYGSNGPVGFHDTALVKGPGIVVGRKGTAGEVVWCDTDFFPIDTTYYVDVDTDIYSIRWLYYVLRHADLGLLQASTGVPGLSRSDANKLILPVPGKDEQARIAALLSKVDATISKTQASITSAQKLKRCLMQNLLTGKLKPDGSWRSDAEFVIDPKFGRVPKGWRFGRLGEVAEIIAGHSPSGDSYNEDGRGLPVLNGPTEFTDIYPVPVQYTTAPSRLSQPGDILFTVRGSTTGRMNIADREYCIGRGLAAIRAKQGNEQMFVFLRLQEIAGEILAEAKGAGSTFPNVNRTELLKKTILIPGCDQQELLAPIKVIEDFILTRQKKTGSLQNLKESLMQNLLTGKVRVPPDLKIE